MHQPVLLFFCLELGQHALEYCVVCCGSLDNRGGIIQIRALLQSSSAITGYSFLTSIIFLPVLFL